MKRILFTIAILATLMLPQNGHAQVVTTDIRPVVPDFYSTMETGLPGFNEFPYYTFNHPSTKSWKVSYRNKIAQRTVNNELVHKQIAAADSLDSVTMKRAIVYEKINMVDRSRALGGIFGLERDRLEKILQTFNNNINLICTPEYGGSQNSNVRIIWAMKYQTVYAAMEMVSQERLKAVERKRCYINLYKDVQKYNKSLGDVLSYLRAMNAVSTFKPSSFTKADRNSYKNYACGRWKLAYYKSIGK